MTRLKTTGTTSLTGEQLTDAIRQEHAAVSAAAQSALQHALEAGRLLADARRNIPHGSWESYVKDSCGIAPRTASLYLRLHRKRDRLPNRQHVADLSVRQAAKLLEQPRVKAVTVTQEAEGEADRPHVGRLLKDMQVHLRIDEICGVLKTVERGHVSGESLGWQADRLSLAIGLVRQLRDGLPATGKRAAFVDKASCSLTEALSGIQEEMFASGASA